MVAAVVGTAIYQYNTFVPRNIDIPVSDKALAYFADTWESCRLAFDASIRSLPDSYNAQAGEIIIDSPSGEFLALNFCHVPARNTAKKLLIITSGVHGVEGYVGSAVQQMFLKEVLPELDLDKTGVLLIHGINAYGFKHKRRVSEKNIDLNRNCSVSPALYNSSNDGYVALNHWLNKQEPVDLGSLKQIFFLIGAVEKIATKGMATLRQAVLQGQYQFEQGIYFGGNALDDPIKAVTPMIKQTAGTYDAVFCIDLHTGYGERGTMHLFPNPMEEGVLKDQIKTIFTGYPIDWGNEGDFYTVTGDFATYVGSILPDTHYLTMTFEFGTLDSQTTFGAISSLHRVILENQGTHHGFAASEDEIKTKKRFLEGYYPSSDTWRTKAIQDARNVLTTIIPKYTALVLD